MTQRIPTLHRSIPHAYVEINREDAKQLGVSGTPTFFVNGRKLVGAQPIERFRKAIDEELARAERLRAEGFRGAALNDALVSQAAALPDL